MKTLGIDLGGHKIAAATVDFGQELPQICSRLIVPTPESRLPDDVMRALVNTVLELSCYGKIESVGIGLPGFISKDRRHVEKLTNFEGFENLEFVVMLENMLKQKDIEAKVFIENDANCFAIGEGVRGTARGISDFVVLTLGSGIGAGIVTGGRLLLGAHGQAAEAGHMTGLGELPCKCGGVSHIETFAAADGIERRAAEKGLPADFKMLWNRRNEDTEVRALLEQTLDALARCVASVSVVTDPEIVVLNGGMSKAIDLIETLTPIVMKYLPLTYRPNLRLAISSLGADAVFYGAASLGR